MKDIRDSEGFGVTVGIAEEGYGYDPADRDGEWVPWPLLELHGPDVDMVYLRPDVARELAHELLRLVGEEVTA